MTLRGRSRSNTMEGSAGSTKKEQDESELKSAVPFQTARSYPNIAEANLSPNSYSSNEIVTNEVVQGVSRSLSPSPSRGRAHRRLASSPEFAQKLFSTKPVASKVAKSNIFSRIRKSKSFQNSQEAQQTSPMNTKKIHRMSPDRPPLPRLIVDNDQSPKSSNPLRNEKFEDGIQDLPLNDESPYTSFDDDDSSIGTQESEYDRDCSSRYDFRASCFVYKRKAGFSGYMKQSNAVASERLKKVNKNFWQLGKWDKQMVNNEEDDDGNSVKSSMWERRRLVMEGRHLMYYHEDAVLDDDERNSPDGKDLITPTNAETTNDAATSSKKYLSKNIKSLNKQMKKHFNYLAEHAHLKAPDINNPKGVIDLVGDYATATVVPVTPNSFAPTPYCLAIMVKSEVKWMLCFENDKEILKWLNRCTKVALTQSVARFAKNTGKRFVVTPKDTRDGSKTFTEETKDRDISEADLYSEQAASNTSDNLSRKQPSLKTFDEVAVNNQNVVITFALVNCAFLYLFVCVDKVFHIPHFVVFALVNILTWKHISSNVPHGADSEEVSGNSSVFRQPPRTPKKSVSISENGLYGDALLEDDVNRTERSYDQLLKSPSFVEKKSMDYSEDLSCRPNAGSSTIRLYNANDSHTNADGRDVTAWMAGDPSIIQLRGHDYLSTKMKIPSSTSLYELVELDAFDSHEVMTDVGERFNFPDYDYGEDGNWSAPDTLIISFALPTTAPTLGGKSDGKGYIVCGYFRIRPEVRKILQIVHSESMTQDEKDKKLVELFPDPKKRSLVNAVNLWEKWVCTSSSDPEMQKRLKFIPRGENLKELGVPNWICRYNGKPMLIKRPGETSFVFSHPDKRTLEIDVNMHPLPFMFKNAMSYLKQHYFSRMLMVSLFIWHLYIISLVLDRNLLFPLP